MPRWLVKSRGALLRAAPCLSLLAARLDLPSAEVERLLAGLVGVRVVDGLVRVDGGLLDAVRVAFTDGQAPLVGAVLAGRRATSQSVGRPPQVISAAPLAPLSSLKRSGAPGEQLSGKTDTTGTADSQVEPNRDA